MNWAMAAVSPDKTVSVGVLRPAISRVDARFKSLSMTSRSWAGAKTANMLPVFFKSCINRARVAINLRPSSKENTPAIQAATYSPTL